MSLTLQDFQDTKNRIDPYVNKTPLVRCEALEKGRMGCRVFLKLENEQLTNSFKVRGAFNALLGLNREEMAKGVVTRSSGNFAQSLAYAGRELGIETTIVMPKNAPEIKIQETLKYNPTLVLEGTTHAEANLAVERIEKETGAVKLSPFDHLDVIAGQGTIALEVYKDLPTVKHFYCPIGGGGLMSGCANAIKLLNPNVETIGVEPQGACDYELYRESGLRIPLNKTDTICDGLRAPEVGELNRPLLDKYVDRVTTVTDAKVIEAMRLLSQYCLIVEPSAAASVAGFMEDKRPLKGDVVCVISGANITQEHFNTLTK